MLPLFRVCVASKINVRACNVNNITSTPTFKICIGQRAWLGGSDTLRLWRKSSHLFPQWWASSVCKRKVQAIFRQPLQILRNVGRHNERALRNRVAQYYIHTNVWTRILHPTSSNPWLLGRIRNSGKAHLAKRFSLHLVTLFRNFKKYFEN